MPFARVGAMPQPNSNKSKTLRKRGSNSSSKPKGITMEDLKKQTALRLAQEQQQKQGNVVAEPSKKYSPPQPVAQHQFAVYPQYAPSIPVGNSVGRRGYPAPEDGMMPPNVYISDLSFQYSRPQVNQLTQSGGYENNSNLMGAPAFAYADNTQLSPRDLFQIRPLRPEDICAENVRHYSPTEYSPHMSSHPESGGESYSRAHRGPGAGKQKLPHGLTVHELKEMTKARLQAEAAEMPQGQNESALDSRRVSPLDFDSLPEIRERAASRDSSINNNTISFLHHGPGSTSSIPSMVQVNQQLKDPYYGRQSQGSPLPATFQNTIANTSGSAFHHPRVDTWESTSVASYNSAAASENHGSESAYSGGPYGLAQTVEYESQHGNSNAFQGHRRPSSAHVSPSNGNSFFDPTITGNRQRATTLSPRAISIHEDRPILHVDELGMPNFTSTSSSTLNSRPSRTYSPLLGLDDAFLDQHAALAPLGGIDLNRPRTSSATSLPISPHGTNAFNRDRASTFSGYSTVPLRGDGLSESVSNALIESFLRVSGNGQDLNQVRNLRGFSDDISAPPGFCSSSSPGLSSSSTNLAAFGNRDNSSTTGRDSWEGAIGGTSLFASDGIDDLASTMGSILKLSGVGSDRPDRERSNTYPYGAYR